MDEGMSEKKRQQREGSYLRPRQLVYKSSPERRNGKKKSKRKTTIKRCSTS